jgi:hypothetical protein
LLLVYVGPRATHFTGYCCWLTKEYGVSGNTLYWVLLLGLCWASGNTFYWVLLLVYVGPWVTHFTGSDVGLQQWV